MDSDLSLSWCQDNTIPILTVKLIGNNYMNAPVSDAVFEQSRGQVDSIQNSVLWQFSSSQEGCCRKKIHNCSQLVTYLQRKDDNFILFNMLTQWLGYWERFTAVHNWSVTVSNWWLIYTNRKRIKSLYCILFPHSDSNTGKDLLRFITGP